MTGASGHHPVINKASDAFKHRMDPAMHIEIRPAEMDEAESLTELSMRSKRSNGYDDAFMDACRAELTVAPSRMEEGEYWVAEAKTIVGWVCLKGLGGEAGEIQAFFIEPDCKRRGIGRRLWRKAAERARALGMKTLYLDADPAAVPFYEALGFATIGEVPSGSIEGRTLPRMMIMLDPSADGSQGRPTS